MYRAFQQTPNYEPYAIAACDERNKIVALLIAVRVSIVSGLASYLSSRSIMFAEPLIEPTPEGRLALKKLVGEHDRVMQRSTLFAEVRPIDAPADEREVLESSGYAFHDYLNYVVDVSRGTDTLWNDLSKSTRNKIRRSLRRGVEVEQHSTHASVDRMYALVSASYQESRVPLADVQLFHAALDHLPRGVVQIRIASLEGTDVAAGIGLMFHGRFYAWYGGSLRIRGIAPFDCLTWDEIRWTSEQGGRFYDFGGAGWPDEEYGPREFKAKFQGDLRNYGRYRRVYSTWKVFLAKKAYHAFRGIVSPRRKASDADRGEQA